MIPAVIRAGAPWMQKVAGRTVLERIVSATLEAGAMPCIILSIEPPPDRIRDLPGVRWTRDEGEAREWLGREYLLIETDALYDTRLVRWVMESRSEPGRARAVRIDGRPALSKVHIGEKIGGGPAPSMLDSVPKGWLFPVRTRIERDSAHEWLFECLKAPEDPLLTKLLERPIAGVLSHLLWRLPLAGPFACGLGLAAGVGAAARIATGHVWTSAALLLAHLVFDRAGRDLARLKLDHTRVAGLTVHWPSYLTRAVVMLGAAAALRGGDLSQLDLGAVQAAGATPFGLGGAAAASLLAIAALSHGAPRSVDDVDGRAARRWVRLTNAARRNDLVVLAIAAAFSGKYLWLLWAAGLGLPVLAIALIVARTSAGQEPGGASI